MTVIALEIARNFNSGAVSRGHDSPEGRRSSKCVRMSRVSRRHKRRKVEVESSAEGRYKCNGKIHAIEEKRKLLREASKTIVGGI